MLTNWVQNLSGMERICEQFQVQGLAKIIQAKVKIKDLKMVFYKFLL